MKELVVVNIRLDESMVAWIDEKALACDRSRSNYIRQVLAQHRDAAAKGTLQQPS